MNIPQVNHRSNPVFLSKYDFLSTLNASEIFDALSLSGKVQQKISSFCEDNSEIINPFNTSISTVERKKEVLNELDIIDDQVNGAVKELIIDSVEDEEEVIDLYENYLQDMGFCPDVVREVA